MSLPTKTELETMDYAWQGQPFVNVPGSDLSTYTMDVAWQAQPFIATAVDFLVDPSDSVTVSESHVLELVRALSDSVSAIDSASLVIGENMVVVDSVTVSESHVLELVRALSDSVSASDSAQLAIGENMMVADSVSVLDASSKDVTKLLSDTATAIDDANITSGTFLNFADSVTISDNASIFLLNNLVNVEDSVTASDSVSLRVIHGDEVGICSSTPEACFTCLTDRQLLALIHADLCNLITNGFPSGLDNINIMEYGGIVTSLGQKLSAFSIPVVLASDQVVSIIAARSWTLDFLTDQVDASGSSVSVSNFPATVAVTQSTSPWVVSLTSTTITGNVTVIATDLDIRNLVFATDKVDASGSTVSPIVGTTGGATPFRNAAVTNTAVAVKASAGKVWSYNIFNPGVALAYLHFYDVASGGVVVGTTTPTRSVALQSNATSQVGVDTSFGVGIQFATAISIAATTTPGGGTAPGTALVVNIDYA